MKPDAAGVAAYGEGSTPVSLTLSDRCKRIVKHLLSLRQNPVNDT
jgi:hypothetical protein